MGQRRKNDQFRLNPSDKSKLVGLLANGMERVRVIQRAQGLLAMGAGQSSTTASVAVRLTPRSLQRLARKYEREGLDGALFDKWNPYVHDKCLDARQGTEVIAMACGPPPDGHARWSTSLLAEQAVARGICPKVGRETIRILLHDHDIKPWREKNVVRGSDRRRVRGENGGSSKSLREASRSR